MVKKKTKKGIKKTGKIKKVKKTDKAKKVKKTGKIKKVKKTSSTSNVKVKAPRKPVKVKPQKTIPKGYGESEIVLLPRDPYCSFAYWELTEKTRNEVRTKYGKDIFEKSRLTLRVYDITGIKFNGRNANSYFDITIDPIADKWYINMPEPNKKLCVDIGIILPDGRFIAIVGSNVVDMPQHGVSPVTDERWGVMQKEFENILKLSGIEQVGKSSFDVVKLMRERWNQFITLNMPSSPSSPLGMSSFRQMPVEEAVEKGKKEFCLQVNTELILYGSTESDAKLTIGGERIKLNPDGSFSLRFSLNDGVKDLPVKATSADNTMSKAVTFTVSRKTT